MCPGKKMFVQENVCAGTYSYGILSIGVKIHTPSDLLQGAVKVWSKNEAGGGKT